MAHIADFLVDTTSSVGRVNHIARELSPNALRDAVTDAAQTDDREKYVWRMHQPIEARKYQLFPTKEKLSVASGQRSPEPDLMNSQSIGQLGTGDRERDRSIPGTGLRLKLKEPTLVRRRKISVPELGPMTTVQEIAMDSPTIPGRPPLHERSISAPGNEWRQNVFGESILSCISGPTLDANAEMLPLTAQATAKDSRPRSPRSLPPLIMPSFAPPQPLFHESSRPRLRSGSTPPNVPPKSARMRDGSPHSRASPYTPMSGSTTNLSTVATSVSNTPNSALESRSSPNQWPASNSGSNPMPTSRDQSESLTDYSKGHHRSDSENSIMDRGRPTKRLDGSPIKRKLLKRRTPSEERKIFETLPQGVRANKANLVLPTVELEGLRKQAVGQAVRFDVLSSKDVEALSRELRGLDERCDYLRKTHRSLRAGRRNLHERICSYLRSPRVARFSHESLLRQEEALAELDTSIDDWVFKLEQAENRRTRVRQKLLEHVAAALILPPTAETTQQAIMAGQNTPPRSPTKAQSPQCLAAPVQVTSPEPLPRKKVESIKIYADSDVYALLADVEDEINRMGENMDYEASKVQERDLKDSPEISSGFTLSAVAFSPSPAKISAGK